MWAIVRKRLLILLYICEYECKTRVDTTIIECNTISCNAVLDQKKKFTLILRNTLEREDEVEICFHTTRKSCHTTKKSDNTPPLLRVRQPF